MRMCHSTLVRSGVDLSPEFWRSGLRSSWWEPSGLSTSQPRLPLAAYGSSAGAGFQVCRATPYVTHAPQTRLFFLALAPDERTVVMPRQTPLELPPMLRVRDVAAYLNISMKLAYRLVKTPGCPLVILTAKAYRVPREAFLRWLERPLNFSTQH